jgi:hypothetical protein
MSHHLDTPLASQNGQLFIDDLYVFPGAGSTVFVMNVNSDITGVYAQPGFHSEARYEIKLHVDGAQFEDVTYRAQFGEPGQDGRQPVALYALSGEQARDDFASGDLLLEGRTGETITGRAARLWAGRIPDSFYIDLSLLAIVNAAVKRGTAVDLTGWSPQNAANSFANTTVESIVVEIPHSAVNLQPGTRLGVWCATKLATDSGGWRQINRAGHPMMWPIFWPDDTRFTYPANTRHPAEDADVIAKEIADRVAAVAAASEVTADPRGYGEAVAAQLAPDLLPYVVGTPAHYGFAGINGRTLADNAPEVMLSLVVGTAIPSGLTPAVSGRLRQDEFPYVVPA